MLAIAEKSYAAQNFLQWFVEAQVEEIATALANVDIIKKAGPNVWSGPAIRYTENAALFLISVRELSGTWS